MLSLEDLHANRVHQLEQCHSFSALSVYCSLWIKNGRKVSREYGNIPLAYSFCKEVVTPLPVVLFEGLIVQNGKIGMRK